MQFRNAAELQALDQFAPDESGSMLQGLDRVGLLLVRPLHADEYSRVLHVRLHAHFALVCCCSAPAPAQSTPRRFLPSRRRAPARLSFGVGAGGVGGGGGSRPPGWGPPGGGWGVFFPPGGPAALSGGFRGAHLA